MKIKFWGTRGSIPSPLTPQQVEEKLYQTIISLPDIDTKDEKAVRAYLSELSPLVRGTAGGNTPCVQVQAAGETIIIDAGSGLRELGHELMQGPCGRGRGVLHLLISHLHWDHIQGFPFFTPAFIPGNHIYIYGIHDVKKALKDQQRSFNWPISLDYMQADKTFISLEPGQAFNIGRVHVNTLKNTHPGDSYSYCIKDQHSTLVYASDVEYKEMDQATLEPFINFFRHADALIFDAQYTLREAWQKVDWGHSSAMIGVDLARAAGVKTLVLFHHDPAYSDSDLQRIRLTATAYQSQDFTRPTCKVIVAYEGLNLDLTPPGSVDLQFVPNGHAAILTPTRIFDERGVDQLAQQLARALESTPSSIIDLSQVETLSTSSLKSLIKLSETHQGDPIVLAAPSKNVRQVIKLSGYQDFFAIYASIKAALQAVETRKSLNLPGQVIQGRYQIQSRIGQGRLGTILHATDMQNGRAVVLKMFSISFSQHTIERFMRQAAQVISLDHPHIVRTLACKQDKDLTYQVEEFVHNQTLQKLLTEQPISGDQVLSFVLDISRALEYAHSRGVIHGNLRPANVLLTDKGVKLTGFGLGRLQEGHSLLDNPLPFLKAAYLSPEQILGQPLDARTDLYALGVILYQLLTGQTPFVGSDQEVMQAHLHQEPMPPRQRKPYVSPSLEHLVIKLLAKNPNNRYTSAQQARSISTSLIVHQDTPFLQQEILVGRQKQLQMLLDCWQKVQAGQGQVVFISGESGIGKTRLAQKIAALSKAPVLLLGQCHESSPAYDLFGQVLRTYFSSAPPEFLDDQACQQLVNLGPLVPDIHQMLPDLPKASLLEPEQEQLRLMISLTQFIRRATQERPWLLILDDLQRADSNSLQLLRYLCRHLAFMPLFIIGLYRDVALASDHPLRETLRDLNSQPTFRQFALDRLDQADVSRILVHIWQQDVPQTLVKKIYQQTQGNPFYVQEVAKSLMDEGLVTLQAGQWHFPTLQQARLPSSVRKAVWRRIGHLDPGTQDLLQQAAVLGPTFKFVDLREMSGLSEWQTLEHLDAALERELIQEIRGDNRLGFRHAEIHQVIYKDLGPLRCRLLHRQAAETLERRALPHPERIAKELAHHYTQANEIEHALNYSLQAAHQAKADYANAAAISWYERTLQLLEQLAPEQAAQFSELRLSAHESIGQSLIRVSRYEQALEHLDRARAFLETQDPSIDRNQRMASLCYQIARVHNRRSQYQAALEWLEKGLSYLDKNEQTVELVRIYHLSGYVHICQGKYQIAREQLNQSLLLAQAAQLRQVEGDNLRVLGVVCHYIGDYAGSLDYYEQALSIYQQIGDKAGEGTTFNNIGIIMCSLGKFAQAVDYYKKTLFIYNEIDNRWGECGTLNNLGLVYWQLGDYEKAKSYHQQSLQLRRQIGHREGEGGSLNNLGFLYREQGDYAQAQVCEEQALQIRQEVGDRQGIGTSLNSFGLICRDQGDYRGAQDYHEQALQLCREIGDRAGESSSLAHLGLLYHRLDDPQQAHEYSQQALSLAQETGDRLKQADALLVLGHALRGLGQLAQANESYQQSLDTRRQFRQNHLTTEPLTGLTSIALMQGEHAQALNHVENILNHLKVGTLDGTEEPFWIYLTSYRALRANQDPRAEGLLRDAHELLQKRAVTIQDDEARRSYLEDVAVQREIVNEFAALD